MQDDDAQYYRDRQLAAFAMSQAASDPAVRKIHRNLASRYGTLANEPTETALEVGVLGGNVEIVTPSGEEMFLTPKAAAATSDRLLARSREAGGPIAASTATADPSRKTTRSLLSLRTDHD